MRVARNPAQAGEVLQGRRDAARCQAAAIGKRHARGELRIGGDGAAVDAGVQVGQESGRRATQIDHRAEVDRDPKLRQRGALALAIHTRRRGQVRAFRAVRMHQRSQPRLVVQRWAQARYRPALLVGGNDQRRQIMRVPQRLQLRDFFPHLPRRLAHDIAPRDEHAAHQPTLHQRLERLEVAIPHHEMRAHLPHGRRVVLQQATLRRCVPGLLDAARRRSHQRGDEAQHAQGAARAQATPGQQRAGEKQARHMPGPYRREMRVGQV